MTSKKESIESNIESNVVFDKIAFIKEEREELQKRLDAFVKQAQQQIDMIQGAIAHCNEIINNSQQQDKK